MTSEFAAVLNMGVTQRPPATVEVTITHGHLAAAREANPTPGGWVNTQTCVVAQALREHFPDLDGCGYHGAPLKDAAYALDFDGVAQIVRDFDAGRDEQIAAQLPFTFTVTRRQR